MPQPQPVANEGKPNNQEVNTQSTTQEQQQPSASERNSPESILRRLSRDLPPG